MGGVTPAIGQRVVFDGDGGKLLGTYLAYALGPVLGSIVITLILVGVGVAIDKGGVITILMAATGFMLMLAGMLCAIILFTNKFYAFYYESLTLDGQPCQYIGTTAELAKLLIINAILTSITCGIYTPWAMVRTKEFVHSNVLVGGQANRLTFTGDPASLLGTYILGIILTYCTFGLYGPWFSNSIIAFMWENTKLDGRPFQFRKDPGGYLGWTTIAAQFTFITLGVYFPWGICSVFKWEAERVV
jgi:hypothetical protein